MGLGARRIRETGVRMPFQDWSGPPHRLRSIPLAARDPRARYFDPAWIAPLPEHRFAPADSVSAPAQQHHATSVDPLASAAPPDPLNSAAPEKSIQLRLLSRFFLEFSFRSDELP